MEVPSAARGKPVKTELQALFRSIIVLRRPRLIVDDANPPVRQAINAIDPPSDLDSLDVDGELLLGGEHVRDGTRFLRFEERRQFLLAFLQIKVLLMQVLESR